MQIFLVADMSATETLSACHDILQVVISSLQIFLVAVMSATETLSASQELSAADENLFTIIVCKKGFILM